MQITNDVTAGGELQLIKPFGAVLTAPGPNADLRQIPSQRLRDLATQHRLLVLRGFRAFDKEGFESYCSTWGKLLRWDYGFVLELAEHPDPKNYIFANGNVPFHWDGAFAESVPNFQFFQCNTATPPDAGGHTLFCNTIELYKQAPPELRALWANMKITYLTEKLAHYGGRIEAPIIGSHPVLGCPTLRFNEPPHADTPKLNVPEVLIDGMEPDQVEGFFQQMRALLYDPRYCYAHVWRDGDMLIADNHALLHGRTAFRPQSPRYLYRVHIL